MDKPYVIFVSAGDLLFSALFSQFEQQFSDRMQLGWCNWDGLPSAVAPMPDAFVFEEEAGLSGLAKSVQLATLFPGARRILVFGRLLGLERQQLWHSHYSAFVSRQTEFHQLFTIITRAIEGHTYVDPLLHEVFATLFRNQFHTALHHHVQLTAQEIKVVKLACADKTSQEIADKLNVGLRTVESHKRNIIRKTQAKSFLGAMVILLQTKVVGLDEISA